jgi:hypothetical protein
VKVRVDVIIPLLAIRAVPVGFALGPEKVALEVPFRVIGSALTILAVKISQAITDARAK